MEYAVFGVSERLCGFGGGHVSVEKEKCESSGKTKFGAGGTSR
jgi:hypothetical protein